MRGIHRAAVLVYEALTLVDRQPAKDLFRVSILIC
jgi:hypothetical protein